MMKKTGAEFFLNQVIDTFLLADNKITYRDLHIDRTLRAFKHFCIPHRAKDVAAFYQKLECNGPKDRMAKGRIIFSNTSLSESATEFYPLDPLPQPVKLSLAHSALSAEEIPKYRFKTNDRSLWTSLLAQTSADDIVAYNPESEITETSRFSLFLQVEHRLITPPLACGGLDGVLRSALLQSGYCKIQAAPVNLPVVEEVITIDRLKTALQNPENHLYVGNSVRGLLPALLIK
jgi:para-aminobenzoate synthetase / 4-amino-4-deoxychorismate lyase